MVSRQYLDLIVSIIWRVFERVATFQQRYWFNLPIHWNPKTKRASSRPLRDCLAIVFLTYIQIPFHLVSWTIIYLQSTPKYADPRLLFGEAVTIAFGSVINFFITNGSFTIIDKRRELALSLNVVAAHHFCSSNQKEPPKWAKKKLFRKYTLPDLIVEGVFILQLLLASAGLVMPFVANVDPFYYFLMDMDRDSWEWYISKYGVRPTLMEFWTSYAVLIFFNAVVAMLVSITHGYLKVPHTPMEAKCFRFAMIHNTYGIIGYGDKISRKLLETGYKEYRQFQVYIRIANDAMYFLMPIGLCGVRVVSIVGGFMALKGFSILPLTIYMLFPVITLMCLTLIFGMVPIACHVFENAVHFKRFWLGHTHHREVLRRLRGCRPMGIMNGSFGYIRRSLPMEMSNGIANRICDGIVLTGGPVSP